MKKQDKIIVSLLREDSRRSLTEMSRLSKIPISTLYDKLKNYQGSLIQKHTTLVDFTQLGFAARARVLLKVKRTELPQVKEHLLKSPGLNELYKVNNGYDFMAEFIFKTMQEMENYLDILSDRFELEKEEVFYIIDELGREEFLSKKSKELLEDETYVQERNI